MKSVEKWLSRVDGKTKGHTHATRKTDIYRFVNWADNQDIDIESIKPLELEDYFLWMSNEGYAPTTISGAWDCLNLYYNYLMKAKNEESDDNDKKYETPFEHLERREFRSILNGTKKKQSTKEDITYFPREEIDELCANVPDPTDRNELIVRLMFQTGVRAGEATRIELSDIDRDLRSIKIHAEKTHQNRDVYYQPSLDTLMDLWIDGGGRDRYMSARDSDYLLVSRKAPKLKNTQLNRIVVEAAEEAGLQETMYVDKNGKPRKKYTSHSLRHSHAIEAVKQGIDVENLRRHLGHKDLDMTMEYLRFIEEDTRNAFKKFGQ